MKERADPTRIYQLVVTFTGRKRKLSSDIESTDERRLLRALADGCKQHAFFEVGGFQGRHCLFNTAHVIRLNLLDPLPGFHVEAAPVLTGDEAEEEDDVRAISDEPAIVRLWLRDTDEPLICREIDYDQWKSLKIGLIEGQKFISFTDEDAENVIYGTDHIDAIEMIDPFYLDDDAVEKILAQPDDYSPADPSESPLINPLPPLDFDGFPPLPPTSGGAASM